MACHMKDIIALLMLIPVLFVLLLIGDADLRNTASHRIRLFAVLYIGIILAAALIVIASAAARAYRKSGNPKKRKNLRVLVILGAVLAAAYIVLMLIL